MTKPCDQCGKPHNRKRFCSNKCKDRYHNIHNPRGYYAPGKQNDIISKSFPQNIIEMIHYKSFIASDTDFMDDHGDHEER